MSPKIRERLSELRLIERREWPNGQMWRTTRGDRVCATASDRAHRPQLARPLPHQLPAVRLERHTVAATHPDEALLVELDRQRLGLSWSMPSRSATAVIVVQRSGSSPISWYRALQKARERRLAMGR
jgi:hypothetical protein